MEIKQYIVDAFTNNVFEGNPAAVCVLDGTDGVEGAETWPDDKILTSIALENNLSETAFTIKSGSTGDIYRLRWFTPGGEIDLCGHATLATAYVIMRFYRPDATRVNFATQSGILTVVRKIDEKARDLFELNFPAYELEPVPVTDEMTDAFGAKPSAAYLGRDLLCVFDSHDESGETGELTVRNLTPNMDKLEKLPGVLQHVTARGLHYDCVSRSFAPKLNIPEDPVCGSGHCHILPFWGKELRKTEFIAYQASRRGGVLGGRLSGSRVYLSGGAVLYSEGVIHVPD